MSTAKLHHRWWFWLTAVSGDYKRMRKIADEVGALLMVDMAHPAGLIAAGLLDNPVNMLILLPLQLTRHSVVLVAVLSLWGKDFDNPWGLNNQEG